MRITLRLVLFFLVAVGASGCPYKYGYFPVTGAGMPEDDKMIQVLGGAPYRQGNRKVVRLTLRYRNISRESATFSYFFGSLASNKEKYQLMLINQQLSDNYQSPDSIIVVKAGGYRDVDYTFVAAGSQYQGKLFKRSLVDDSLWVQFANGQPTMTLISNESNSSKSR